MTLRKYFLILLLFCLNRQFVIGQEKDNVKIIPGKGIIYNNDSILIDKTTLNDLMRKFKISKKPQPYICIEKPEGTLIDDTSKTYLEMELNFKSLTFSFNNENHYDPTQIIDHDGWFEVQKESEKDFSLSIITINPDSSIRAFTDNGIVLGMVNPSIREKYPLTTTQDYVSEAEHIYVLLYYGISLSLKELNNELIVNEIRVLRRR